MHKLQYASPTDLYLHTFLIASCITRVFMVFNHITIFDANKNFLCFWF